jgi:hypothetical protein
MSRNPAAIEPEQAKVSVEGRPSYPPKRKHSDVSMTSGVLKHLFSVVLLLPILAMALHGQDTLTWTIGLRKFHVDAKRSDPLKIRMKEDKSLKSLDFVGRVGGVAFCTAARPDGSVTGSLKLSYDGKSADGKRLHVTIGRRAFTLRIPDWQLIPIARYADSEFNSCVSLFGPQTDKKHWDIVYHESFLGQLLGMRLLQADILFMDLYSNYLLPERNGSVISGEGEEVPREMPETAMQSLQRILKKYDKQSWVLTDEKSDIRFGIAGDSAFTITGTPYYHFWTAKRTAERGRQLDSLSEAARELNAEWEEYGSSSTLEVQRSMGRTAQRLSLQADSIRNNMHVNEVTGLIKEMRANSHLLDRFNKPVWSAVCNTARFAAFFRYVKSADPGGWSSFLRSIRGVDVMPHVKTPNRLDRSN